MSGTRLHAGLHSRRTLSEAGSPAESTALVVAALSWSFGTGFPGRSLMVPWSPGFQPTSQCRQDATRLSQALLISRPVVDRSLLPFLPLFGFQSLIAFALSVGKFASELLVGVEFTLFQ